MRRSTALPIDAERLRTHADDAAQLLKALANEKRLLILCLLSESDRSVGDLHAQLDLSQSALSQHLAVLRAEGLVKTRRAAQTVVYSLSPGPVRRVMETLHAIYCARS